VRDARFQWFYPDGPSILDNIDPEPAKIDPVQHDRLGNVLEGQLTIDNTDYVGRVLLSGQLLLQTGRDIAVARLLERTDLQSEKCLMEMTVQVFEKRRKLG
jgi:hypothetical protein